MGLHLKLTQLHEEMQAKRKNGETITIRQHLACDYAEYYAQDPGHALEHLLSELNINPNTMNIDQLLSLADGDKNLKWLWYEMLLGAIIKGINEMDFSQDIIAVTVTKTNTNTFTQPYIITENMKSGKNKVVAPGGSFDVDRIAVDQKTVKTKKRGRALEVTYETIRFSPLNLIGTFFAGFGAVMIADKLAIMVDVLINGEKGRDKDEKLIDESAGEIGVYSSTAGITYKDLIRAAARLWRLGRPVTHMVGGENQIVDIITLEEYLKREQGVERAKSNLRSKITAPQYQVFHDNVPDKKVILVSPRHCLARYVTQGVMIENDKDIHRQLHQAVISYQDGFSIIHRNARVILDGNSNFTSWPTIYDVKKPQ